MGGNIKEKERKYMHKCNGEPRSRNHCCRAKAMSVKYSVSLSVALDTQQTKPMRRVIVSVISDLFGSTIFFST